MVFWSCLVCPMYTLYNYMADCKLSMSSVHTRTSGCLHTHTSVCLHTRTSVCLHTRTSVCLHTRTSVCPCSTQVWCAQGLRISFIGLIIVSLHNFTTGDSPPSFPATAGYRPPSFPATAGYRPHSCSVTGGYSPPSCSVTDVCLLYFQSSWILQTA